MIMDWGLVGVVVGVIAVYGTFLWWINVWVPKRAAQQLWGDAAYIDRKTGRVYLPDDEDDDDLDEKEQRRIARRRPPEDDDEDDDLRGRQRQQTDHDLYQCTAGPFCMCKCLECKKNHWSTGPTN